MIANKEHNFGLDVNTSSMDKDKVKSEQEEPLPPHPSFDDFVKYLTFQYRICVNEADIRISESGFRELGQGRKAVYKTRVGKVDDAIGESHVRILTDYETFVLKETPLRVHSSCSTTLAAILRTAIWNRNSTKHSYRELYRIPTTIGELRL
jgi:hypothetical protein